MTLFEWFYVDIEVVIMSILSMLLLYLTVGPVVQHRPMVVFPLLLVNASG